MLQEQSRKALEERVKTLEAERSELEARVREKEEEMRENAQSLLAQEHNTRKTEQQVSRRYSYYCSITKINNIAFQ